jgi:uncharacterized iron-regulated protein
LGSTTSVTVRQFGILSALSFAIGLLPVQAHATDCAQSPLPLADLKHGSSNTNPLIGRVWHTPELWATSQPDVCGNTPEQTLLAAATNSAAIVLLGEIHDNNAIHAIRAAWIKSWPTPRPTIVFEQIRADQQPALDTFAHFDAKAARLGTTNDLLRVLDWVKSPWSKTADYRPLFEAVVQSRLAILPGDPPRDLMRRAAKEGLAAALPATERSRLGLDTPLSDAQNTASLAEIDGSHCGMIPKSAQPNMAEAQRYRDAHMADALLRGADATGQAILIAGNGHVRTDRAAPWYIRNRAPDRKIVSVMFIEVQDGKTDPEPYIPRDPEGHPAADFIIFTPPGPNRDQDPCEGMKAQGT